MTRLLLLCIAGYCWLHAAALYAADEALIGAGATFPATLYQKWIDDFQKARPGLPVRYESVGSVEGLKRLREGRADFAASDIPLAQAGAADLGVEVPSVAGAVVAIYNLPNITGDLRLTPGTLAGIYLGTIKRWNDPAIQASNRSVKLPARPINVVHRADGSGSTFIWTTFLSTVSPAWKNSAGSGPIVDWPAGKGAQGNIGVSQAVIDTPFSIGYVEFIYAVQNHLSYAAVENGAGRFIRPEMDSIRAGAANPTGAASYPLVAMTYFIAPRKLENPAKRARLLEFLNWMLEQGQNQAAGLGFIALPPEALAKAKEAIGRIE